MTNTEISLYINVYLSTLTYLFIYSTYDLHRKIKINSCLLQTSSITTHLKSKTRPLTRSHYLKLSFSSQLSHSQFKSVFDGGIIKFKSDFQRGMCHLTLEWRPTHLSYIGREHCSSVHSRLVSCPQSPLVSTGWQV